MLFKRSLCLFSLICFGLVAFSSSAGSEEPPRTKLIISQQFKNIVDNSWSNLEFIRDPQPSGLYYIELTELVGTVGCWGSKKNPYENGPNGELLTAWRDGLPLENGNADFRLQYRLSRGGGWVELIAIPPQAVIIDTWFPFGLQDAQESIGQTFIALEEFTGVGLSTPTWNTNNSGCTISLYSAAGKKAAVEPAGKLAAEWGRIKNDTR